MDKYFLQRLQGEGQTIPPKLFNEIGTKPVTASFRDFYVLVRCRYWRQSMPTSTCGSPRLAACPGNRARDAHGAVQGLSEGLDRRVRGE